jgi:hypothetical protein
MTVISPDRDTGAPSGARCAVVNPKQKVQVKQSTLSQQPFTFWSSQINVWLARIRHVQASFAAMSASFDETVRRMRSPIAALKAIIEQYIDFAYRFPGRYRLLFNDVEIAVQDGELERVATGTFDLVVRLIQAAKSAGKIRDGDPHEFTGLLYGAVHGLVDLRVSGRATLNKGMQDIRLPCWRLVEMLAVKPGAQTRGHKPVADPVRNSKR